MELIYERDLRSMKLLCLKGTRQDEAVLSLATRLGISRQALRKILIARCDMMTLENIAPRLLAADAAAASADAKEAELLLPHLTVALGLLTDAEAAGYLARVKAGESVDTVKAEILEVLK